MPATPNLALEAVANASTAANGQSASKAIDGFINGYKENGLGDYSKEVCCSLFRLSFETTDDLFFALRSGLLSLKELERRSLSVGLTE